MSSRNFCIAARRKKITVVDYMAQFCRRQEWRTVHVGVTTCASHSDNDPLYYRGAFAVNYAPNHRATKYCHTAATARVRGREKTSAVHAPDAISIIRGARKVRRPCTIIHERRTHTRTLNKRILCRHAFNRHIIAGGGALLTAPL